MACSGPSVAEAVLKMAASVRKGDIAEAEHVGGQTSVCLSMPKSSIQNWRKLGGGAESEVFGGVVGGVNAVVKKPVIRNSRDLQRFRGEVVMLSSLKHPNVVPILGARMLPPDYFVVMPNMGDNLHTLIHEKAWQPSWQETINIGLQLARALQAVHNMEIIHRDIKTKNILFGGDRGMQLADFGLAMWLSDVQLESKEPKKALFGKGKPTGGFHKMSIVGTLEYMAPEILQKQPYSYGSDVYAFAVTLNELATGVFPFSDCIKDNPDCHTVLEMGYGRQELSTAVAGEGLRPTIPKTFPQGYSSFISKCWDINPSLRPTISEVIDGLKALKSVARQPLCDIWATGRLNTMGFPEASSMPPVSVQDPSLYNGRVAEDILFSDYPEDAEIFNWEVWMECHRDQCNCYYPTVTMGGFATSGKRGDDRMEDRHIIIDTFMGNEPMRLLGVYDGHRGSEAAQFVSERISGMVANCFMTARNSREALKQVYFKLEEDFEASGCSSFPDPKGGRRFPGCTALTAVLLRDKLFVANAGDCRGILCRNGKPVQISRDHTAMDSGEQKRIEACGAKVQWMKDTWRVGTAGIQVTRSLGDADLKSVGVTAEPEVGVFDLTAHDEFLILASDGLWDTISNEEAIRVVQDTVKNPDMCAQRLAMEAVSRGSHDNVSVIVVYLRPVSTFEKIYQWRSAEHSCQSQIPCEVLT